MQISPTFPKRRAKSPERHRWLGRPNQPDQPGFANHAAYFRFEASDVPEALSGLPTDQWC